MVEHQPGRLVRFERNPDYFAASPRAKPSIGKLELRFIPDINTQMAELLTGGVDWIFNVQQDQATQLERRPELQVTAGDTMRVAFLLLNSLPTSPAPPLRDLRVRRAMIMALDRDSMLKNLVGPGARVLDTICYPGQFGCTSEGAPHYAYDPARARALLGEAGYPNGFDIDIHAYRDRVQTEAMIGFFRAVGIRANLVFGQAAAVRDAMRAGKAPIMHVAWGSFSLYDTSASTSMFYKFSEDDTARDPQVRDWLQTADTSTDPEKRKAGYRQALARIADQAYGVPLYSLPVFYAYTRDLNFTPYPDQLPRFWESSWK